MTTTPKPEKPLRYSLAAAMAQHTNQPAPERKAYSLTDAMRRLTSGDQT
jgi:hypothetical protein